MKIKGKVIFIVLLLIMMVSFPGTVLAQFDEYGFNPEGRLYQGTLENWEAMLAGSPPAPYDPNGTDIVFVNRKWDKLFDPVIYGSLPLGSGAWQRAELWEYLSGEQLGWTWHLNLEVVYSPDAPIPGAIELPPEAMGGFTGFYGVEYEEWLEGPRAEKTVIQDLSINSGIIQKVLH